MYARVNSIAMRSESKSSFLFNAFPIYIDWFLRPTSRYFDWFVFEEILWFRSEKLVFFRNGLAFDGRPLW